MTTAHTPINPSADGAASKIGDRLVLTIAEAADVLGISRAFAYELAARGEIPILRLGRRRLVPRKALLAMVGEEATDAAPAPTAPGSPALVYRLIPEGG